MVPREKSFFALEKSIKLFFVREKNNLVWKNVKGSGKFWKRFCLL